MYIQKNGGVSLIEIVIAISIIALISVVVILNLSKFRDERTLDNMTQDVISVLNKAKSDTISSLNSNSYGVHFQTDKVVYFVGTTYNSSDAGNIVTNLDSSVTIPVSGGINLNGGGSDVTFTRLTGDTTKYGTIIIRLTSDATRQKTVTISQTGVISSN
ncbi:MAG: hypothetical protein AAB477_00715 [Patescibacteria group bacterium]